MITLTAARPRRGENIVPMINVAFLLLIFFLMTAVIAPSDPVRVTPPEAGGDVEAGEDVRIFVEADGTIWQGGSPVAVLDDVAGATVLLSADRSLDGARLAQILTELRRAGARDVKLVVAPS